MMKMLTKMSVINVFRYRSSLYRWYKNVFDKLNEQVEDESAGIKSDLE